MADEFEAKKEAALLKKETGAIRKQKYEERKSRLDTKKDELLALHKEGATIAELQRYLKKNRIDVSHSTVRNWLAKQKKKEEHYAAE